MKILLLLLGIVFFFIFFLFSQQPSLSSPLFGNLYIEAQVYIILSLFCIGFLFFWQKHSFKDETIEAQESEHRNSPLKNLSQKDILLGFKIFFESYVYYIGILFFYISLSLFLTSFFPEITLPEIFFIANIAVIGLYFIEEKFKVFQDLIRVNTLCISLYYILSHVRYLGFDGYSFSGYDVWNIGLLAVLFFLFFRSERSQQYKQIFQSYLLCFVVLEYAVLMKYLFAETQIFFVVWFFVCAILFLVFTDFFVERFSLKRAFVRTWGIIFSCGFLVLSTLYLSVEWITAGFLAPAAGVVAVLLYLFHRSFENYIALLFALYASFLGSFFIYQLMLQPSLENNFLFVYFFLLSTGQLLFHTFQTKQKLFESYVFHIVSLLVNLFWVLSFFLFQNVSILSLAILFAGESIYFLFSYYSLQKKSRLWHNFVSK